MKVNDLCEVSREAARILALPAAPEISVQANRNIRRPQVDRRAKKIVLPADAVEHKPAFAIYAVVHQLVHLVVKEPCACGWGWRSAVHSNRFHSVEAKAMRCFGVNMVYRSENHECELQNLDGSKICDGFGA